MPRHLSPCNTMSSPLPLSLPHEPQTRSNTDEGFCFRGPPRVPLGNTAPFVNPSRFSGYFWSLFLPVTLFPRPYYSPCPLFSVHVSLLVTSPSCHCHSKRTLGYIIFFNSVPLDNSFSSSFFVVSSAHTLLYFLLLNLLFHSNSSRGFNLFLLFI